MKEMDSGTNVLDVKRLCNKTFLDELHHAPNASTICFLERHFTRVQKIDSLRRGMKLVGLIKRDGASLAIAHPSSVLTSVCPLSVVGKLQYRTLPTVQYIIETGEYKHKKTEQSLPLNYNS